MNEQTQVLVNDTLVDSQKLYSQMAINLATYLGGPLAAGVLMRRNFINLGNEKKGKLTLLISLLCTIVLFSGLFFVPDTLIEKIPNSLIPGIYTLIVSIILVRTQGDDIKNHREQNGLFYSLWKSVGVGIINLIVIVTLILAYSYMTVFDSNEYDAQNEILAASEVKAGQFLQDSDTAYALEVKLSLINSGIVVLQESLPVISAMDNMVSIPDLLLQRNAILREYFQLQIDIYILIHKAVKEQTVKYDTEIFEKAAQRDQEAAKLQSFNESNNLII